MNGESIPFDYVPIFFTSNYYFKYKNDIPLHNQYLKPLMKKSWFKKYHPTFKLVK